MLNSLGILKKYKPLFFISQIFFLLIKEYFISNSKFSY